MGGQYQEQSPDGSYRVTLGSVDNPNYPDDAYFITQQDNEGNHMTSIFDSQNNQLGVSYRGRGI